MKETKASFQDQVDEYLIRHRSVLDVLSKLQEATARTNRAFSKAVTSCGCVTVSAAKQQFPTDISLAEIRSHVNSHVGGALCERCREAIETEIGAALFYTAALCSVLDLDIEEIQKKEHSRIKSLGIYNLK
jgi:hypothetical protein